MTAENIHELVEGQRAFFASGVTLDFEYRANALDALHAAVASHEAELAEALRADLGKSESESYMCETGLLLASIRSLRRHLRAYMRPKRVLTGLAQFPGHGELRRVPWGVTLIMGTWNYPLLLALQPLAAALAAGNTAVVKTGSLAPATSRVIAGLLDETFAPEYVCCVEGGREANAALLAERWDRIFFTGGAATGRVVLRAAAENLTPVTLELGGKSPVIVDATADIPLAARRIVAGKLLNCGQTCVAPDYILCERSVEPELLDALRREIAAQCPDALHDADYPHMVNRRHFERVLALVDSDRVVCGGGSDAETLKIEPTVLAGVNPGDAVMGEEIFGPVLPVLTYGTLDEAIAFVEARERPLALYLFTRSRGARREVLRRCRFGGGCINDTVMHLSTEALPFGGMGGSGMGAYHGRWGYEEFSHLEGLLCRGGRLEPSVRYRPERGWKNALIRLLLH